MRNFKKFLTLVLAVMMVVSAMSFTTSAAKFNDVDAKNEVLADAVDLLNYMGVAQGVSETEFGTEQPVTRQQFALFIYRLVKGGKNAPKGPNTTEFTDLVDDTYNYAIGWAASKGIIKGTSATTFNPTGNITLQDAYTMVVRALDYETEETLPYPYGYIEVAEDKGVTLDEGLNSNIDYTDVLTRGDMAIILYNAFFAQTGVAETVTYYDEITSVLQTAGEDTLDEADDEFEYFVNVVTVTEDDYPRLCEKYFDVIEVEYQAKATPNFALEGEEVTAELGYDAIYFEMTNNAKVNTQAVRDELTSAAYLTPEQINVDADKLNDYFLAEFTMFVTADEDEEVEKVLYAGTNFVKKTVNDLKFEEVVSNKAASYFDGTDTRLLTGKVTTGTEEIYFFNAPYSYAKPSYALNDSIELQYAKRNALNIETINVTIENVDKNYAVATLGGYAVGSSYEADGLYETESADLIALFEQAYLGGLYEADLYDVEGDGIYDYIQYTPYGMFFVDTDEDYTFADDQTAEENTLPGIDTIYTNEATLLGKKFADGDLVIGCYDFDQNLVKVAEILKPAQAGVKKINANTNSIVFTDGTTAKVDAAWAMVANYGVADAIDAEASAEAFLGANNEFAALLTAEAFNDEIKYYIYDGVILAVDDVAGTNLKYTQNLIIPVADLENDKTAERQFNTKTGEFEYYIYAWVDGATKYVPVETEDIFPAIVVGGETTEEYLNQLCTYSVDADGIYTITSLAYSFIDEDENEAMDAGEFNGIPNDFAGEYPEDWGDGLEDTQDADKQEIFEVASTTLEKIAANRFAMDDKIVNFTADTKIVVANVDSETDEVEYVVLDRKTLNDTVVDENGDPATIENVKYILSNNVNSTTRENLVVLFFTVSDFEIDTEANKDGYRIVATSRVGADDEGTYRNFYEVYNPFTGKKDEVSGVKTGKKATQVAAPVANGTIIKLADGKVDERDETFGEIDPFTGADGFAADLAEGFRLVWITGYDAEDGIIEVVDVEATLDVANRDQFDAAIETETAEPEFLDVDAATAVALLKSTASNTDSFVKGATISALELADLADAKNEIKAYNDKLVNAKGNLMTKYAKYVKAYIKTTEGRDDENDSADFIVVVANATEPEAFLNK